MAKKFSKIKEGIKKALPVVGLGLLGAASGAGIVYGTYKLGVSVPHVTEQMKKDIVCKELARRTINTYLNKQQYVTEVERFVEHADGTAGSIYGQITVSENPPEWINDDNAILNSKGKIYQNEL